MISEQGQDTPLEQAAEMAARLGRAAGQAERVVRSIQAAQAVAGAVKTGAAVSGAAAGTALAGPLGTVIGAIITSKTFWRIVGAVLAALVLWMFLIANSVGIIFTYLGFESADSYVAQARQAELQTIQAQIEQIFSDEAYWTEITDLLEGYRDQKLEEIEDDFTDNWDGYDAYEVEDEYESILEPALAKYLAVLIEESFNGSQIVAFNGYGTVNGITGDLTSPYDEYFALAAATYQVPEALLKAMAKVESDFNPNAVSSAGAQGLMQLMPATAVGLGISDPFDPKQNIMGGAKYVAELFRTFGSYPNALELVIAAYNAGPNAVKKAGYQVPQNAETPNHVKKVMSYLSIADEGESENETEMPEAAAGSEETGDLQANASVSKTLLTELVESQGSTFFAWSVTGTHTETIDSGDDEEDEEEIEVVDYTLAVTLNGTLASTPSGYSYRYVTDQTTFQYVLKLFQLLENGKDGIDGILFQAASWKNYVTGFGASEDVFSSEIATGGDPIQYDTVEGCVNDVVYYNQGEEPWSSMAFGTSTIRDAGCGPTALAIVISTLTGEDVTPQMTAAFAMGNGEYVPGQGTSHSFPSNAAKHWGLSVERVRRERMDYVVQKLRKGSLAVVICAENTISGSSGHYIVLTGITADGYLTIADPGSRSRTGNLYSPQTIQSYARNLGEGGIWIIGNE